MPPLQIDEHAAGKVLDSTLVTYRRAGLKFSSWCKDNRLEPVVCFEWDDLLVEWKNSARISKSDFSNAVAAVEKFFPQFKGHLPWSHQVLVGWSVMHNPRHTVPWPETCAA